MRMRQHSKNQNTVPNNLRPNPPQPSPNVSSVSSGAGGYINNGKHTSFTKATRIKDQREMKAKRNEWRITKMVLAIFLSFVICYLPITIAKIVDKDVTCPGMSSDCMFMSFERRNSNNLLLFLLIVPGLHITGYILIYLSACINPIIYVIMNKQYRQAYKTVLLCKPSRLLSFRGSSVNGKYELTSTMHLHSIHLTPHFIPIFAMLRFILHLHTLT